jgi:uncharacterized protein with PQ loop repeat
MVLDDLSLIWLVGTLTVIISISVKLIGLPDQIRKNYLRKSVKGVSIIFIALLCLSYSMWVLYGILRDDWFIVVGHGLGVITTGIILIQASLYKKN